MEFSSKSKKRKGAVEINLTPLIDVVFILLIFFLITSTFVTNEGFEVQRPVAGESNEIETPDPINIAITREGQFVLENTVVSTEQLQEKLREFRRTRENATVILQGDTEANLGKVVEVMNIASEVGFIDLAIAADSK